MTETMVSQISTALVDRLTPLQKRHLETVRWLMSMKAMREGRSYLLATAGIEAAMHIAQWAPGAWFTMHDHRETDQARARLLETIIEIAEGIKVAHSCGRCNHLEEKPLSEFMEFDRVETRFRFKKSWGS